jgi:hypothetical protein
MKIKYYRSPQADFGGPMNKWILKSADIESILQRIQITPWDGSPFCHLPAAAPQPGPAIMDSEDLGKAVEAISRPDVVMGLIHWPPLYSDASWFYGAGGDAPFAYVKASDGAFEISWPVEKNHLVNVVETVLSIKDPLTLDGFALSLDLNGLGAFSTIVDLIQEGALISALNRRPPSPALFDADALLSCFERGNCEIDLRWMVQRMQFMSPVKLSLGREGLDKSLHEFERQGFIVKEGALYRPMSSFYTACTLLGSCSGLCALSMRCRNGSAGTATWDRQHISAMRGMGSLWLFEFADVTAKDCKVTIGDVNADLLRERVMSAVMISCRKEAPPVPKEKPGAAKQSCPSCGAGLPAAAKFCSACGQKTETPKPVQPKAASLQSCPQCGAALAAGTKFCTHCGARGVASVETPQPAVKAVCQKCGASGMEGKKFCTKCGSPMG